MKAESILQPNSGTMTRRAALASLFVLTTLGVAPTLAQGAPQYRVGILLSSAQTEQAAVLHFKRGMQEAGYRDGDNIEYLHRWFEGFPDRVPALAMELVSLRANVILVSGVTVARPVQQTVPATPVVMAGGFDPVAEGLAESLSRPGRNVTGIVNLSDELARKHLELVRDILPRARRVGVLSAASTASERVVGGLHAAGKRLNIEIVASLVSVRDDIVPAISRLDARRIDALVVLASPIFNSGRSTILEHAGRLHVPVVYPDSGYIDGGGLISYGPNRAEIYYRAASYVNRILKGAKPATLPIEQPTKFELVINMKTAKALGIKIPNSIMVQATKVIE